jgi:hypothetical protein
LQSKFVEDKVLDCKFLFGAILCFLGSPILIVVGASTPGYYSLGQYYNPGLTLFLFGMALIPLGIFFLALVFIPEKVFAIVDRFTPKSEPITEERREEIVARSVAETVGIPDCQNCLAPIDVNTVTWIGPSTVECPHCGTPQPAVSE